MILPDVDAPLDWRNWNPVRALRHTVPIIPLGTTSASGGILSDVTIDVIVDHTLPAGTIELRSPGYPPVRAINITSQCEEERGMDAT